MRFCTNCGKEMNDDAVFCIGCGANVGGTPGTTTDTPPESDNSAVPEQPNTGGTYYQSSAQDAPTGTYYQPSAQGTPTAYTQPSTQYNQPGAQYNQPGAQKTPNTAYYQQGTQGTPNAPYYQNTPYVGGPNIPGGPKKSNKMVIIIVSVIIGLALIGAGIFAVIKLSNKDDNNNKPDVSDNSNVSDPTEEVEPSEDIDVSVLPSIEPEESEDPTPSSAEGLDIFDSITQDYVIAALEEIGIDTTKIETVEEYGTWFEGDVYTFVYEDSVIDILLYDDGTVFSIETNGTQIYLVGYESYYIDEYLGYTTHFDESYPDNGYAFFLNGNDVDSPITIETSSDLEYLIELVDAESGDMEMAFYVCSDTAWTMDVPAGDYYIQYAVGTDWSGVDYLFGNDTKFFKSDSIYSFYPENESTITLDVYGGSGIASTEITIDDF